MNNKAGDFSSNQNGDYKTFSVGIGNSGRNTAFSFLIFRARSRMNISVVSMDFS